MRVAVVGATGRTGRQVMAQAIRRGHDVTALARSPQAVTIHSAGVRQAAVDVLDRAAITDAIAGCQAVVSAVGIGTSRRQTTAYSGGVANLLFAMSTHGIRRLSVISAAPVGPRRVQPPLTRRIVMPILDLVFGATYADMRRMEAVLRDSDLDWVCLRPPRLVDKAATGQYRMGSTAPPPHSRSLTFADLAAGLLDCLDRSDLYRRAPFIAN